MKKVISGLELKEKMQEAINLLCNTVKTTLGPKGSNVMINSDTYQPFITNDGVTIASSIESEDPVLNTVLEIAKEASIKTNELVGDGTTTTLVLLQSIFNQGLQAIENGLRPITLKKELETTLNSILLSLKEMSWNPKESDYKNLATVSANDEKIGLELSNLFLKMNQNGSIKIREGNSDKTEIKIINGYSLDQGIASDYLLNNAKELVLKDPYVLIIRGNWHELNDIAEIINGILESHRDLCIIAEEIEESILEEIIIFNLQNDFKIACVNAPDFASKKQDILKDISIFTESQMLDFNLNQSPNFSFLGACTEIRISKEETLLMNNAKNERMIEDYVKEIEKDLKNCESSYEREFLKERRAKLKNGIGFIFVGATTKTEKREKKMRYDDALCALECAKKGVLLGEGISYLKLQSFMKIETSGDRIVQMALKEPTSQILENMGLEKEQLLLELQKRNYEQVYNEQTKCYEDAKETTIIDPFEVVSESLKNAVSIASMLLTTTNLIVNERKMEKEYSNEL